MSSNLRIKVAIVEDNPDERTFLESMISRTPGLACAGAYGTPEAALHGIAGAKPDVIVLDFHLPKWEDGLVCLLKFREKLPETPVLMWTIEQDTDKLFAALKAGALGYLVKGTPPADLARAIEEVHQGGAPMSPAIARRVLESLQNQAAPREPQSKLSDREIQILDLLCKGYTNKEIATELEIAEPTVRSHLRRIYEKLHVHSRTEAAVKFLKRVF